MTDYAGGLGGCLHRPVAPLAENRFVIWEAVEGVQARGETATHDALKKGTEVAGHRRRWLQTRACSYNHFPIG